MEFGLFVEPQMGGSYAQLVDLARWAEDFGLDAFARSDHYLHRDHTADATDALTSLAGVAVETSTIRLVTLVSPITFRHPAIMAKAATTLDEISGGRFSLGVGTGWMQSEHDAFGLDLPPLGERFDRLEEALAFISTVFAGGGTTDGVFYSLDHPSISPAASDGLTIVVGGDGPAKTPRLAGAFADEYNLFVTDRNSFDQRADVMRRSAIESGRDPDGIMISFAGPAFIYPTAHEHRSALARRGAKRDLSADAYAAFLDDRCVPHGIVGQPSAAIEQMESWGVSRYYVQNISPLGDIEHSDLEAVFGSLMGT